MNNDPLIGRRLANFQVERPLGRGGMAQVYYGTDVKLNRPVAIKVIDARYRNDPSYAKRFVREAQSIATWRHQNIIQIYYADDEDGFYYYVMEYIDGNDLGQLMNEYRQKGELMPPDVLLPIGKSVASALDYAHEQGVIHRDVKPANIMVASDNRVVVTDFGLAMDVEVGSAGEVFGSARYVAPEQARNSAQAVPQSDIYALGIVMYEILTGKVPFDDPSSTAVALQHITLPPPAPRQINDQITKATEQVLLKALDKKPENRFQTGAVLMEALEQALLHDTPPEKPLVPPKEPEPVTPAPPIGPPSATAVNPPVTSGINPMVAAGAGAVAIVILLMLGYLMLGGGGEETDPSAVALEESPTTEQVAVGESTSESAAGTGEEPTPEEEATPTPEPPTPTPEPPTNTPEPPTPTPTPTPEPMVLADSEADFSNEMTNWEYLWSRPGRNAWEPMQAYSANHYGRPCWYTNPNHVRICNDFGNPGNNDDIAWRWTSDISGTLEIQVRARKLGNGGDGVVISVYKDSTEEFPSIQEYTNNGLINEDLTVEVEEGDPIYFVMNRNGSETLDDTEFYAKICQVECPPED